MCYVPGFAILFMYSKIKKYILENTIIVHNWGPESPKLG